MPRYSNFKVYSYILMRHPVVRLAVIRPLCDNLDTKYTWCSYTQWKVVQMVWNPLKIYVIFPENINFTGLCRKDITCISAMAENLVPTVVSRV